LKKACEEYCENTEYENDHADIKQADEKPKLKRTLGQEITAGLNNLLS